MHTQPIASRLFGLFLIGLGLAASTGAPAQDAPKTEAASAAPTAAEIRLGRELFLGTTRFSAGGPSCNSCHNVVNDAVIGGGTLAMDLTESFGRLGAEGIPETLPRKGAPSPFPVMQVAYQGRDITAPESQALVAFLQDANAQSARQKPNDFGARMLLGGLTGVVLLFLLFSLIGQGRKRRSVNQDIYDRQVVSE